MMKLVFEAIGNSSDRSSGMMREIFLFQHGKVCWVYSIESPHRDDTNKFELNIPLFYRRSKISP